MGVPGSRRRWTSSSVCQLESQSTILCGEDQNNKLDMYQQGTCNLTAVAWCLVQVPTRFCECRFEKPGQKPHRDHPTPQLQQCHLPTTQKWLLPVKFQRLSDVVSRSGQVWLNLDETRAADTILTSVRPAETPRGRSFAVALTNNTTLMTVKRRCQEPEHGDKVLSVPSGFQPFLKPPSPRLQSRIFSSFSNTAYVHHLPSPTIFLIYTTILVSSCYGSHSHPWRSSPVPGSRTCLGHDKLLQLLDRSFWRQPPHHRKHNRTCRAHWSRNRHLHFYNHDQLRRWFQLHLRIHPHLPLPRTLCVLVRVPGWGCRQRQDMLRNDWLDQPAPPIIELSRSDPLLRPGAHYSAS